MIGVFDKAVLEEKLYRAKKEISPNLLATLELLRQARLRGRSDFFAKTSQRLKLEIPKFEAVRAMNAAVHNSQRATP